jgi:hypothetical protein
MLGVGNPSLEDPMNPYDAPQETPKPSISDREAYNLVTDTVAGPNVRLKDNLFQAVAIFVSLLLGAGIGALVASDLATGIVFGGFLGLLVGLFGSGIVLMIFRAVQHSRGRHE